MTWHARPPIRSPFARRGAEDGSAQEAGPLRLLTVCTGNICRSAYAHHVLQARLDAELGPGAVDVGSAGTGPNQALAVPAEILALAPDDRVRDALSAHRPRLLTAAVLRGQDLVLAATDAHLDAVAREAPAALRRAATLLDAGALLTDPAVVEPGSGGAGLRAALAAGRRAGHGLSGRSADLPDPFRGPAAGYRAMADALDPALATLTAAVVRACRRG